VPFQSHGISHAVSVVYAEQGRPDVDAVPVQAPSDHEHDDVHDSSSVYVAQEVATVGTTHALPAQTHLP